MSTIKELFKKNIPVLIWNRLKEIRRKISQRKIELYDDKDFLLYVSKKKMVC